MSCPTCDHTMQVFLKPLDDGGPKVFHCSRCGTQKILVTPNGQPIITVPTLVERCREFRAARHPSFKAEVGIFGDPVLVAEWERLGIAEAINKPEDRK